MKLDAHVTGNFEGFPKNSALFGLLSCNDPCPMFPSLVLSFFVFKVFQTPGFSQHNGRVNGPWLKSGHPTRLKLDHSTNYASFHIGDEILPSYIGDRDYFIHH